MSKKRYTTHSMESCGVDLNSKHTHKCPHAHEIHTKRYKGSDLQRSFGFTYVFLAVVHRSIVITTQLINTEKEIKTRCVIDQTVRQ